MHRVLAGCVSLLALAPNIVWAAPLPTTGPGILALVAASKALEIDPSLPNPSGDKNAPWVRVAHAPEGTNGGYIAVAYAQRGMLSGGMHVLALPLDSSGSGGVFTQLVFAQSGGAAAHYVGYVSSGGHLGLRVVHGALVAEYPDYGPNDPNCCPSHYLHDKYVIASGKLRVVATWRTVKM